MQKPEPGEVRLLDDGVRALLAPNPGPMTHWGTNSYILGEGDVALIDPGPEDPAHFEAIIAATRGERISHILVTHAHADHSPLASRLSHVTGAPILGFGPPEAGRSEIMQTLAASGFTGGGEGVDQSFAPTETLSHGDTIDGAGWSVGVVHTPGHFAGHLSFRHGDTLFSGDHVMDWSSTLISPPDGDLGAFMSTCEAIRAMGAVRLYPGHGHAIDAVDERLSWLVNHRRAREMAILDTLSSKPANLFDITAQVYRDVPDHVLPAASRNVFAHLIDLVDRNLAKATPQLSVDALFHAA